MTRTSHSATKSQPWPVPRKSGEASWPGLFAASAGLLLGVALLKFGNPVIFDRLIARPTDIWEFLFQPWPITWGYGMLGGLILLGFRCGQLSVGIPKYLLAAPLVWLVWQGVASLGSTGPELTRATMLHFVACVSWFYLGAFSLSQTRRARLFLICLLPAFLLTLWFGFQQHYGGLEATRRYFYEQPNWREYPPEYLKRMASDRIFSTLVYPNAFAGAILVYLPVALATTWQLAGRLPRLARTVSTGLVAYMSLACLFWTGSRSGWLIAILLAVLCLSRLQLSTKQKQLITAAVLLLGLVGFLAKNISYFQRGATSVSARFDYWNAALKTFLEHPGFGTGPGTFSLAYARIKPPDAEMAKLAHNDYLEQASDSGIIGIATYLAFIVALFAFLYRQRFREFGNASFAIWLGVVAWSVQGVVEFPLYIPALSWPVFAFMGWLCATPPAGTNGIDDRSFGN